MGLNFRPRGSKLYMHHEFQNQRNSFPVQFNHDLKNWNKVTRQFKPINKEVIELNNQLMQLQKKMLLVEEKLVAEDRVTKDNIKELFIDPHFGKENRQLPYFFEALQAWIDEDNRQVKKGIKDKKHKYNGISKMLYKAYDQSNDLPDKNIFDINKKYVKRVLIAIRSAKSRSKEHFSQGSQRQCLTRFTTFLNDLYDDYNINKDTRDLKINWKQLPQPKNDNVAFTPDELNKLWDADLSDEWDYRRDLLLLSCYCGARYSDCYQLGIKDVSTMTSALDGSTAGTLRFAATKNNATVRIPVVASSKLEELLERIKTKRDKYYNDKWTFDYNYQRYNNNLSELCKMVGIDNQINILKNGVIKEAPKYEFITSHIGRHTYSYIKIKLEEVSRYVIQDHLGHESVSQTEDYIKRIVV